MPKIPRPDISVIIPAYNASETIIDCLASLEAQKTEHRFEIIVVVSSMDQTSFLVKENYPDVTLMTFPDRMYPGEARNVGISHACARVIAFMDSDCQVDTDWIDKIVEAHRGPDDVVGGSILNGSPSTLTGWAYYFCEFNLWLPRRKTCRIPEIAGCAMSMKKQVFDRYGPFIKGTFCSDTAMHWKMQKDGINVLFDPSIRVYHTANYQVGSFLSHFFSHRRQFARLMVRENRFSDGLRLAFCLLFLLLPFILASAAFLRVILSGAFIKQFLIVSPLVFAGMTARVIGEFWGVKD
jgi:GT2 family glycosyltransferase